MTFVGCSNDKDLYDPDAAPQKPTAAEQKHASNAAEFAKQFGTISPDQIWGFTDQTPASTEKTRGTDPKANDWANYVNVPEALDQATRDEVMAWFAANPNPESTTVNYCDFFVRYVGGTHGQMDHLICGADEEAVLSGDYAKADHIFNFNQTGGSIMFMVDSHTGAFGYHSSQDSKDHTRFVIIPGATINEAYADLYFVAFDYEATGNEPNQQEAYDGYYTDWVVCITPGEYKDAQRIICEDLGTIGDYDFNDVVFDVRINYNEWWHDGDYAVVTVLAAGGTLPLTIEGVEVHELLGVAPGTMVNTNGKSVKLPVAQFRIPKDKIRSANAKDIEVCANGIRLTAEQGQATEMLCVPTTYKWTQETVNILQAYPMFKEYVNNNAPLNWYELDINTDWLKK